MYLERSSRGLRQLYQLFDDGLFHFRDIILEAGDGRRGRIVRERLQKLLLEPERKSDEEIEKCTGNLIGGVVVPVLEIVRKLAVAVIHRLGELPVTDVNQEGFCEGPEQQFGFLRRKGDLLCRFLHCLSGANRRGAAIEKFGHAQVYAGFNNRVSVTEIALRCFKRPADGRRHFLGPAAPLALSLAEPHSLLENLFCHHLEQPETDRLENH